MRVLLTVCMTLFFVIAISNAVAKCPSTHPKSCGGHCCPASHFCCGKGCAPKGTNCIESHHKYCPGDKAFYCPNNNRCYKNHVDAGKYCKGKYIMGGAPAR